MRLRILFLAALPLLAGIPLHNSMAQSLDPETKELFERVATALPGLVDRIKALEEENQQLRVGPQLPGGAVVAFATECPKPGWDEYKEGWGRVLIGAVTRDQLAQIPGAFLRDARGVDLDERPFGNPGGEQQHLLTIDEMPEHSHDLYRTQGKGGNGIYPDWSAMGSEKLQVVAETLPKGGGNPHNIMPPYVALHFCKKN